MIHTNTKIYEIADVLDMAVHATRDFLDGSTKVPVMVGDLPVVFKMEVVSSLLTDAEVAVICKVRGNLAMLVLPLNEQGSCAIYVLDMALMKKKPENYIEDHDFHTAAELVADLQTAIVKWFTKMNSQQWIEQ